MTGLNESIAPQKTNEPFWYVVHTYSGYENKVKNTIEMTIENRNLHDKILEVRVPTEKVIEIKDGEKKTVDRKLFPGYVLIRMIMDDETWYIVRNTRGVTGFVGPGSKAVPLEDYDVNTDDALDEEKISSVDFEEGDEVEIIDGMFKGQYFTVKEINLKKQKVKVVSGMFARGTDMELNITEVKKASK